MGNKASAATDYENGRPSVKGGKITPGFKDRGNGLLFRIVKDRQWYYYNDTKEFDFHVKVTFNEDCDITALGSTQLEALEDGKLLGTVVVYPTQTVPFIKGRVNGFSSKMDAMPVSEEGKTFYESNKVEMQERIAAEKAKSAKKADKAA